MNKFKYISIVASSVLLFSACGSVEHKHEEKNAPTTQIVKPPMEENEVTVEEANAPVAKAMKVEADLKNSAKDLGLRVKAGDNNPTLWPLFIISDTAVKNLQGDELSLYEDKNGTTDIRYEIVEPSDYVVDKGYDEDGNLFYFIAPKKGHTPKENQLLSNL